MIEMHNIYPWMKEHWFLGFETDRGGFNDTTRKEDMKNKAIEPNSVVDDDMDESLPISVAGESKTDDLNDKSKKMGPKPAVKSKKRECASGNDKKKRELENMEKGQKGKFVVLILDCNSDICASLVTISVI